MPTQKQNQNPVRPQSNEEVDPQDLDRAQRTQKDQGRYQPTQQPTQQPDRGDTIRRPDEDREDT